MLSDFTAWFYQLGYRALVGDAWHFCAERSFAVISGLAASVGDVLPWQLIAGLYSFLAELCS